MKIIIEKNSGVVLYFFNDWASVEITETAMLGEIVALDIKSETHELITNVEPPEYYQLGGALTYINEAWAIGNAELYAAHEQYLAEQEAAYKAMKDAEQATSVRSSRSDKLKDSDWTQVADATVDKAAWATYRQELRDISAQAGFPWTVVWSTQP